MIPRAEGGWGRGGWEVLLMSTGSFWEDKNILFFFFGQNILKLDGGSGGCIAL